MPHHLSIPKSSYVGLQALAKHQDKLATLRSPAAGEAWSPEALTEILAANGVPRAESSAAVRELIGLQALMVKLRLTPKEMIQTLTASLTDQAPPDWKRDHLPLWHQASATVESVLDPDGSVNHVRKYTELAQLHRAILQETSVIVDARPVMSNDAQSVVRWIVSATLSVAHRKGHAGEVDIDYYNADISDIREIHRQCERAILKFEALRKALTTDHCRVHIEGEESQ
jgi:hypothetical protein